MSTDTKTSHLLWKRNQDFDTSMTFEDDPYMVFEISQWNANYEYVWFVDPRFVPINKKVWAMSVRTEGKKIFGIVDMGYLTPSVYIEYNEYLPSLTVDIDQCCPPVWELENECAYELDPAHQTDDQLWVVKFTPAWRDPKEWKWMGVVTPTTKIEYNPDLPPLEYDLDYTIPWYDLRYEHVWMLDRQHLKNGEEDIWAFKITASAEIKGSKVIGSVSPAMTIKYNPNLSDLNYDVDYVIPWHDFAYEHMWMLDRKHLTNDEADIWAFKVQLTKRPTGSKVIDYITPTVAVEYNPDLPQLSYELDYTIPWHDLGFEHVWLLDRNHLTNDEADIWTFKIRLTEEVKGSKHIDYITPTVAVEYNPDLPPLEYDLDYIVPWHDLGFEHVWLLDRKHLTNDEADIWAFKIRLTEEVKGSKHIDFISPTSTVVFNPKLPKLTYDLDYIVPWHDLAYEHVWMLDARHCPNNEDIWAFKISYTKSKQGIKYIDFISPNSDVVVNPDFEGLNFELSEIPHYDLQYENIWMLEDRWAVKEIFTEKPKGEKYVDNAVYSQYIKFNPALKNLYVDIDYRILEHDRFYEHVWYTEIDQQKIWAAKLTASDHISGTKEMGMVVAELPQQLDVVFISYGEINAEENWQRVLSKAPTAKRVDGVTGILEAHQAAADLVSTDMFYVVDGDAYLDDSWTFDFQPSIYDRECTHVWHSINPVTGLAYGYGGVKLFHTMSVKKLENWKTDLTMSVSKKLKVIETVSNITKFNTSEFNTWRSAFRECAKLAKSKDPESSARLQKWLNPNGVEFASWAKLGAQQGVDYAKNNLSIKDVNDYYWLLEHFKELNGRR
jgi:hypothetical protein